MTQAGECTHQIDTQLLGRWDWVSPHPTRLDKVLICPQEENTVHPLLLTRQDTWDSSTNGRSNPAFPLCPLSWHVCSKACPDIITGLHALPQQFWKGYFARKHVHTSWFALRLSQKAGNRPQLSQLFIQHIFWHSCRAHREWAAGWMNGSGSSNLQSLFFWSYS